MRGKAGRPALPSRNWRTGKGYPEDLPGRLWAWEFQRRNPDYRELYRQAERWLEEEQLPRLRGRYGDDWLPPWKPGAGYLPATLGDPLRQAARSWGVSELIDPKEDAPARLLYVSPGSGQSPVYYGAGDLDKGRTCALELGPGEVAVTVDLRLPVASQVRRLARGLRAMQVHHEIEPAVLRRHWRLFRVYLRLLDAAAAGAKRDAIAEALTPEEAGFDDPEFIRAEELRKKLEAARALTVPSGYLALAAGEPPAK